MVHCTFIRWRLLTKYVLLIYIYIIYTKLLNLFFLCCEPFHIFTLNISYNLPIISSIFLVPTKETVQIFGLPFCHHIDIKCVIFNTPCPAQGVAGVHLRCTLMHLIRENCTPVVWYRQIKRVQSFLFIFLIVILHF